MKKNKINDGHYLELMDRLHVQTCVIEDHLVNHPLTKKIKKVKKLVYRAGLALSEAYQIVGQKSFENDERKNPIKKVVLRRHKDSKK
jgi:4-diphosphocytidyl-2C-methyl-D-erythritol kinase